MSTGRRARIVLPVWKIFLMHLPFRPLRRGGPGFAPGLRASLVWAGSMVRYVRFDSDRIKYFIVRLRQIFS